MIQLQVAGLMTTGEGPGPERVVELLEARLVVTSWISWSCC